MNKVLTACSVAAFLIVPAISFAAAGPTITLVGNSVTMKPGTSYVEPGYSATDPTDGNITSSVVVANGVNVKEPGNYTVNYSVTDSLHLSDSVSRTVTVLGFGAIGNPCAMNGTCPCPMSTDPITGNHAAWKACAVLRYPKLANGDTIVCRLSPMMPGETHASCAVKQAGFGEELITPTGVEIPL